jgi:hypothetical protein
LASASAEVLVANATYIASASKPDLPVDLFNSNAGFRAMMYAKSRLSDAVLSIQSETR